MLIQYHLIAAFFALVLPIALYASRWVIRAQRSAVYNDVIRHLFPEDHLPQLDLVAAKYGTSVDSAAGEHLLSNASRDPISLLVGTALYAILCFVGFEILLLPAAEVVDALLCSSAEPCAMASRYYLSIPQSFFWSAATANQAQLSNAVAVGGAAFLGGYVAAARNLTRQALNYELNGMSFVRSIVLMMMAVIVAVIFYRSFDQGLNSMASGVGSAVSEIAGAGPNAGAKSGSTARLSRPPSKGPAAAQNAPDPAAVEGPSSSAPLSVWLGTAFLIGMAPDVGLTYVSRRLKFSLSKAVKVEIFKTAQIVPVEIIDGIDSVVAYRLEESNIEDVQNLATANPIMLYIETPFGLFEVFDWVLQAQLCLVMGPDVFVKLKSHGIRTIFDLERAVLSDGVPDAYVEAVGQILFAAADAAFVAKVTAVKAGGATPADIIRHAVAVTGDDLHIHRLRTLWLQIQKRSWPDADRRDWIYRRQPLPGDAEYGQPTTLVDAWLSVALAAARGYLDAISQGMPKEQSDAFRSDCLEAVRKVLAVDKNHRERLKALLDPQGSTSKGAANLAVFRRDPEFRSALDMPNA